MTFDLPGALPFSDALKTRLEEALSPPERAGAGFVNRLALATSPYLRQHCHNPVNWFEWGDEAFALAKSLGRPVLLSVGYSTCHWCHVMARESFEDLEIARYLNAHYVAIKVDREERPDVDAVYMAATQLVNGGGGWPMTVWLLDSRTPFHAGTYFPPRDGQRGMPGFLTVLAHLHRLFKEERARVEDAAADLSRHVRSLVAEVARSDAPLERDVLRAALTSYRRRFDERYGGLEGAPKFPSSLPVRLLLRCFADDGEARRMATMTLARMAAGGIYDQIGSGFHRYSTDAAWLVPHFEKMLYDNALLLAAYVDGDAFAADERFGDVAQALVAYVAREMTAPEGGFYAATDADSATPSGAHQEGYYFTWTRDELTQALGAERATAVAAYYDVTAAGNFEGRNVLSTPRDFAEVARACEMSEEDLRLHVGEAKPLLYAARQKRPAPHRDEKILTAWNGLMIFALARAGWVRDDGQAIAAAARAAERVTQPLVERGRLLRVVAAPLSQAFAMPRGEHAAPLGFLDDYAFVAMGLLELFSATSEVRWLERAIAIHEVLRAHFWDREGGGFFMTSDEHEALLAREKPAYDGAEPSGNSIALQNLVRLWALTTDERYRRDAEAVIAAFGDLMRTRPMGFSEMLIGFDELTREPAQVLILRGDDRLPITELTRAIASAAHPAVWVAATAGEELAALAKRLPWIADKVEEKTPAGGVVAYVCHRQRCLAPVASGEALRAALAEMAAQSAGSTTS